MSPPGVATPFPGASGRPHLARIIHERSVNNPGLHLNGPSQGGMTSGGCGTGCRSRVPRVGCGVEMLQGGLIRPESPIPRDSGQAALFASCIRESCGLGATSAMGPKVSEGWRDESSSRAAGVPVSSHARPGSTETSERRRLGRRLEEDATRRRRPMFSGADCRCLGPVPRAAPLGPRLPARVDVLAPACEAQRARCWVSEQASRTKNLAFCWASRTGPSQSRLAANGASRPLSQN